jgi:predicted DNA-binding protein with PD1-like motif
LPQQGTKQSAQQSTAVRHFAFRLLPHQDLRQSILQFAETNNVLAGAVVTCVGSLESVNLRFANQSESSRMEQNFEIVSLVGTFSTSSAHLHLSVADKHGVMTGGHLLGGNLIYTTAEIVIVELLDLEFAREEDSTYGYHELVVKQRNER